MNKASGKKSASYDYYLVLVTCIVLAVISVICIYGMFYFKFAQVQQMPVQMKTAYMDRMNLAVSPFVILMILLLGICVPKRLLPVKWLNRFAVLLLVLVLLAGFLWGVVTALQLSLCVTLVLQLTVLIMAVAGSKNLHFETKGYWLRVGSSLMHLGLILFILDLFFYQYRALHLLLFWVTTATTVTGMVSCFYSQALASFVKRIRLS